MARETYVAKRPLKPENSMIPPEPYTPVVAEFCR